MENIDLFDKYIDGKFSPDEKKSFESRLNEDTSLLSEFRIYLTIVLGICSEGEQDNKDFGEALKRISKEELLDIIGEKKEEYNALREGMESTAEVARASEEPPKPSGFKKWILWQGLGVAALLGFGVIYVVIAKNEANTDRQNALAMYQESLNKVDNAIYAFSDFSQGISRAGGIEISNLSDDELNAQLPDMETTFREQTDDIDIAEYGSELVMAYIRLHERDKAKQLLTELIIRFQNNSDYENDVINWKTILSLLK